MLINSNSADYGQRMQRCREYVEALEEERRKIQVFQRELPLCLELVNQAIEACKQQLPGTTTEYFQGQSECSEQTSTEGPVLEEFIPIKRVSPSSSDDDDDGEQQSKKSKIASCTNYQDGKNNDHSSSKSDWLGSAQLWSQNPDPSIKEDYPRKVSITKAKRNVGGGGAFHPFKEEKKVGSGVAAGSMEGSPSSAAQTAAANSSAGTGGDNGSKKEDKGGQCHRKARRCWSQELHKRFLQALQQLGGVHVATPKQIRELMKVDGLTNDEVKSHLQKYRLHTRRPYSSIHNNNPQGPQFVVVGGIWVPPPEYAAAMTKTTTESGDDASGVATTNGIYSPLATIQPPASLLNQRQQRKKMYNSDQRGCHIEGGFRSISQCTTTSSTHTTTTSHAF